jgi:hypothetical protein
LIASAFADCCSMTDSPTDGAKDLGGIVSALSYTIDHEDRLINADVGYFAFAKENFWAGVDESIGRPLWDFVSGATMQKVQRSLLGRVRGTGHAVGLPFRCDGPTVRRELTIEIAPLGTHGDIVFSAHVLSQTTCPAQALLDPREPRGEAVLEMCGWCDRFRVEGEWMEVEAASLALRLTTASELPQISHGLCDRCADMLASS